MGAPSPPCRRREVALANAGCGQEQQRGAAVCRLGSVWLARDGSGLEMLEVFSILNDPLGLRLVVKTQPRCTPQDQPFQHLLSPGSGAD